MYHAVLLGTFLQLTSLASANGIVCSNRTEPIPDAEMLQVVRIHYTPLHLFGGCGVQISDRWVITAKHCVKIWSASMLQIRVADNRIGVAQIILHPDPNVDLALIQLTGDGIPMRSKIDLFNGKPAAKSKLWLGGYGFGGQIGHFPWPGKFRSGYNQLDGISGKRGKMTLDQNQPNEALPLLFDSGSPVFIQRDGHWLLFGITVTASNRLFPTYGGRSHHQLVGTELKWISSTIN
jgi:hypothetical protein